MVACRPQVTSDTYCQCYGCSVFILSNRKSSGYLIGSMMMLVHDVGCGVKSLTRPLTFLLINLGTASEI